VAPVALAQTLVLLVGRQLAALESRGNGGRGDGARGDGGRRAGRTARRTQ
jgi:hypothetical protein